MVVGCSGVVGVEMVGAWDFRALVGTVSLLLTAVAGDVVKKSAVSSWGCLNKCCSVSCCVNGVLGIPIRVVVVWNWGSALVEHSHGMV